jgi:uncharacterized protein YjbI with pentapeptide repeats
VDQDKTSRERTENLIRLLVSDWRPTPRQGLWGIRAAILLGVLISIGYAYGITLWDWAQLLIVPAALAGGVAWLNWAQRQRDRQAEEATREREREAAVAQQERLQSAEEARRKRELEIEKQRAQDEALQAYLDQMSQMLINKERPLRRAQPGDDLSVVVRASTLTVLTRMDFVRKGSVVRFLYEAGLITKDRRFLDLSRADLSKADLWRASLIGADLHGAYLTEAWLSGADLSKANLREAALHGARLNGANLSEAWLSKANLSGATVSDKQLTAAKSLRGATMPNGQKYEDWLKSKGRGKDGENSAP